MKKIFAIIVALLFVGSISVNAQRTFPRYGTATNQNQTFGGQKLSYRVIADVAGGTADTFRIVANSLHTDVKMTVTDVVAVYLSPLPAFYGDIAVFNIANTAGTGHIVYFSGAGGAANPYSVGSGGTSIALTSAKNATIAFQFNGAQWVELYRTVQ